jgi:hypothetical protein
MVTAGIGIIATLNNELCDIVHFVPFMLYVNTLLHVHATKDIRLSQR